MGTGTPPTAILTLLEGEEDVDEEAPVAPSPEDVEAAAFPVGYKRHEM